MRSTYLTRRDFLRRGMSGLAAATLLPRAGLSTTGTTITAGPTTAQIAPQGYARTSVFGYDGRFPGPLIRAPQGGRVTRRLVNTLDVPTSIHWHGIRIDNAMDGVAGLTQDPVPSGGSFDYDFAVPDAGTYWYHAHTNSMEQVARGLYGPLVVDEAEPPEVDGDEVLMLDDLLLDPETAQIDPDFKHPMDRSHAGRYGNLVGTNGTFDYRITATQGARLRLRLVNAANARIFTLALQGLTGWTVALDGMPLETPEPVTGEIILMPAQRVDLIVDVREGEDVAILRADSDGEWRPQIMIDVKGAGTVRDTPPDPLPPNPNTAPLSLGEARTLDMRMEGGAMGGFPSRRLNGETMDFRGLMAGGMFWTLDGVAGLEAAPFVQLSHGETVRMRIVNDTAFPHAMHLHGMHFRQIMDGVQGPLRDTVLSRAGETIEIAFRADNRGKWLLHCHMLGHAASGMTTWIDVA